MTKLSYPFGWSAGSQVRGLANRPAITRGTSTSTTATRTGTTRTTTVSSAPSASVSVTDAVSFQDLYTAWIAARRGKKPSNNQIRFETQWIDNLLDLQKRLSDGAWNPSPSTCFVAKLPKAREIHAPDFADRVVHHWLIPELEAIYNSSFIFDSFSNRVGKGTHAAVNRLRGFIRQVYSGQDGGWYLQLDVHNFFNSIHRPTLYSLLKEKLRRSAISLPMRRATHALLRHSPLYDGVKYACTDRERSRIPPHKRLENSAPGCGIAIGNLSSQFFANIYLNELDQFVKHELKARRYVRYVDDFVLVHTSREQLIEWRDRIASFLANRLRLKLKADQKIKPIESGIDFLGYIVKPTHTVVRRRVIHHARQKLTEWNRGRRSASHYRKLQSTWQSYCGHFSHSSCSRLHARFHRDFPWLRRELMRCNQKMDGAHK